MNWQKLLCLGDSMTHGSRDWYGLSWPYYLAQMALDDGVTVVPEVLATPGWTSSQLLRAAWPVIEASEAPEAVLFIGTNDTKDEVCTPVDQYIANVRLLLAWLGVRNIRPYLCLLPMPSGFGSPNYTVSMIARLQEYNAHLAQLPVHLVDLSQVTATTDAVHFSPDGNRETAGRVWQAIRGVREFPDQPACTYATQFVRPVGTPSDWSMGENAANPRRR